MKKSLLSSLLLLVLSITQVLAQDAYTERAKKYIDEYATLAMFEQRKSGIPASITLGQGILETEAGASELMIEANNHFGIKCKNGWQGPTFSHTDDAPNECFKKYSCAAESYRDHSEHLHRNPRYAPLFSLPPTDYAGWAKCLKKCGYATNPQYAERLIRIIEDFKLQDYTYSALDSSLMSRNASARLAFSDTQRKTLPTTQPTGGFSQITGIADSARAAIGKPAHAPEAAAILPTITRNTGPALPTPTMTRSVTPAPMQQSVPPPVKAIVNADSLRTKLPQPSGIIKTATTATEKTAEKPQAEESKIVIVNGLKAFYAFKDEMLLQYAMKYHVSYQQLLAMNDLTDGPLPFNMHVYLEHKLVKGTNSQHIVRDGESLLMAAQAEGMQLRTLRELNLLNPNEEPVPGTVLELQTTATRKPTVAVNQLAAHNRNSIVLTEEKPAVRNNDYIAINKPATSTFADTARPKTLPAVPTANPAPTAAPVARTAPIVAPASARPAANQTVQVAAITAPPTNPTVQRAAATPPAQASQPAKQSESKYYKVIKGDTAFSIAKRNNITVDQLSDWNDLTDNQIKVGQTLKIKE